MKKAVFGLATTDDQARRIVNHLLTSGFSNQDISILSSNQNKEVRSDDRANVAYDDPTVVRTGSTVKSSSGGLSTEKHTKAPEMGVTGATVGGVLGTTLGLLAGIGALAIPGLGPFVAAGPIMGALSGLGVGGSVGLLIGALIGAGIPEYEAKRYEAGLKEGNILISVHTDNDDEIKKAHDIMKKEGAKDISTTCEKSKN